MLRLRKKLQKPKGRNVRNGGLYNPRIRDAHGQQFEDSIIQAAALVPALITLTSAAALEERRRPNRLRDLALSLSTADAMAGMRSLKAAGR